MSEAWEQFWAVYPRREAKKDALKAWRQAGGDRHIDAILTALTWQRESDQWQRGYIPLAGTYLRGERWTDENPAEAVARMREADRAAEKERHAAREAAYAEWQARKRA